MISRRRTTPDRLSFAEELLAIGKFADHRSGVWRRLFIVERSSSPIVVLLHLPNGRTPFRGPGKTSSALRSNCMAAVRSSELGAGRLIGIVERERYPFRKEPNGLKRRRMHRLKMGRQGDGFSVEV